MRADRLFAPASLARELGSVLVPGGPDGQGALIDYAADQADGTATFTVTGIARGTEVSPLRLLASAGQRADLVGDPLKLGRSPA